MRSLFVSVFALSVLFVSCTSQDKEFPVDSIIDDVASIIQLGDDSTRVFLSDYMADPLSIDSLAVSPYYAMSLSQDKKYCDIVVNDKMPAFASLRLWSGNFTYDIPMRRSLRKTHQLILQPGDKKYTSVNVVGNFNGWTPGSGPMIFKDGAWQTSLSLNPGKYQYRFIADDTWMLDPANPDSIDNNYDGFNSVFIVEADDPAKVPFLFSTAYNDGEVLFMHERDVANVIVFWQNHRLDDAFVSFPAPGQFKVKVPSHAKEMKRSQLRVYAWNEAGISNDLMIPLSNGMPISDPGDLMRTDKHAFVMYFMMVDRFSNGNTANDENIDHPDVLPEAEYHGGDIAGITHKIQDGYFNDLGINTIWLSPVVENPPGAYGEYPDPYTRFTAYHGYWPISFTKVEPRFGTADELKELVNVAHDNDMNVLLDFVANHVHEEHPTYKENPAIATDLYLPDGSLNTEKWDEHRLTTWFDVFLPTLDLTNPEISEMLSDSAVYWLKEYGIDGFRHDATKHIPLLFWRMLTEKIKENVTRPEGKSIYQVGETYGSRELIGSYVGSGMLDGQFDFDIYHDGLHVLAQEEESMERLEFSLRESMSNYGYHHLMGNISGNQDKPRFIALAGGDLTFEEDSKYAGWTRDIGVGDPNGYKRMALMHALNMTIPGIPVIYYGDEFGMTGANDPDNRRMMKFRDLNQYEQQTRQTVKALVKIRRNNLPLIYGATTSLFVDDNTWVYARIYLGEISIVVLNKSTEPRDLIVRLPDAFANSEFASAFGSDFSTEADGMQIKIDGLSFDIITTSKPE